jgi:hypothetical protein
MPKSVQAFLADAAQKASVDLTTAFLRIPEGKRNWSPDSKARTALDQFAECVLLNGYTAETITTHQMAVGRMQNYPGEKTEVMAQNWEQIHAQFQSNTSKVVAAVRAVSEEDMSVEVLMPWGSMTIAQIITYPHWNMTYHEGQINYIASLLGCLE